MNWLILVLLAALFTALMDLFIKLAAGKIHDGFSGFVINLVAALVVAVFVLFLKFKNEPVFNFKTSGFVYSSLAGIAIGIATICLLKMYTLGTNLSIGAPLYRTGTILLVILFAILFLKETISLRWTVGFLLSLISLYLLVTK